MADEPENIVLVCLRRIDAKVESLTHEVREVKDRLSAVEVGLASVRPHLGFLAEAEGRLQVSFDRLREAVTQIERRLDRVGEPAA